VSEPPIFATPPSGITPTQSERTRYCTYQLINGRYTWICEDEPDSIDQLAQQQAQLIAQQQAQITQQQAQIAQQSQQITQQAQQIAQQTQEEQEQVDTSNWQPYNTENTTIVDVAVQFFYNIMYSIFGV
jgi:DNA anti-recombination protein RmuC